MKWKSNRGFRLPQFGATNVNDPTMDRIAQAERTVNSGSYRLIEIDGWNAHKSRVSSDCFMSKND